MTSLETALRRINTDLIQARVPFAVVGGLAVSVRTEPRFTRDADLAVALSTDAEAEALIHTLRACHRRPRIRPRPRSHGGTKFVAAFGWLSYLAAGTSGPKGRDSDP